jgi:hypothetical protein
MTSKSFKGFNLLIGAGQEEYNTLAAYRDKDAEIESVTYCMQLTAAEIKTISETGCFYVRQMTFGQPMQPVAFSLNINDFVPKHLTDES